MRSILLAVAVIAAGAIGVRAASPHVEVVTPAGMQRGTEQEFTLHGDRIGDARELLCYSRWFEVRELTPDPEGKKVTVKLSAAADCPLGEHQFRLRTDGGISPLKTIHVGPFPMLEEVEENNQFDAPQVVPLGHTIEGEIEREDVDFFALDLVQGQRVSLEIEGMRLGQYIFDPYLAVLDARRFDVAVCDDCALLAQDAFISFVAPADGRYVVEVRESSYNAEQKARYRLHVGTFARPTAVHPAAVMENSETEFTFIGDPSGAFSTVARVPAADPAGAPFPIFAERDGVPTPSANFVHVSRFPCHGETEPNNARETATVIDAAAPLCVYGTISEPGDTDWFRFRAAKDQRFLIQAYGRTLRSPVDLVVDAFSMENGQRIEGSDDRDGSLDGGFVFTAPADGEYALLVRDHLGNGGADYVYAVEAAPLEPALVLTIPQFDRNDTQLRQMIPVPRGGRYATLINVERRNSRGDVRIFGADLPDGVQVSADILSDGIGQSPVVFEAAPDAPIGGRLGDLRARLVDESTPLEGGFLQRLEMPRSINNQKPWRLVENDRLAVAVTEEAPFTIDIEPPAVPVVQGGSLNLRVRAARQEGFTGKITLRMLWNPPGIGAQNTIDLPEGQSEIDFPLTAEGNAQTRTWKIAILGEADAGKGLVLASSALTDLTVEPPFLALKIDMATVEKGAPVDLVCNLEQLRPFEGAAKVLLIGLPHKTTTIEREISKDDTQVVFPVTTDPESPVGKHKNLFCQIIVHQAGHPIVHNTGHGGVLRIDDPPMPAETPAEAAETGTPTDGDTVAAQQ